MDISSGLGVLPPNGAGAVSFVCARWLETNIASWKNARLEMPPTEAASTHQNRNHDERHREHAQAYSNRNCPPIHRCKITEGYLTYP
jgi:hypothetical protein